MLNQTNTLTCTAEHKLEPDLDNLSCVFDKLKKAFGQSDGNYFQHQDGSSAGVIVAVTGGVIVVALLLYGIYWLVKKRGICGQEDSDPQTAVVGGGCGGSFDVWVAHTSRWDQQWSTRSSKWSHTSTRGHNSNSADLCSLISSI
ncbi:hypothetical protein NFI96_023148 [Prochilodus magdalenae]|nr:hypothetical protein NFI96_023148 [Prochilodus magdalenae]